MSLASKFVRPTPHGKWSRHRFFSLPLLKVFNFGITCQTHICELSFFRWTPWQFSSHFPTPSLHLEPGWKFMKSGFDVCSMLQKWPHLQWTTKNKTPSFSNNLSAKNSKAPFAKTISESSQRDLLVATAPLSQMLPCTQQRTQRTPQHAKCHQQSIQKYWPAALQALQDVEILGQSPREDRKGLPATCTLERCVLAHTFLPNPCVAPLPIRPQPAAGRKVFSFSNKTWKTKSWLGEEVSCSSVAKIRQLQGVDVNLLGKLNLDQESWHFYFFSTLMNQGWIVFVT